jgi:hypothetical protein
VISPLFSFDFVLNLIFARRAFGGVTFLLGIAVMTDSDWLSFPQGFRH